MSDANTSGVDERIKQQSRMRQALIRPELGGICGTIIVFVLFFIFAGDSGMFNAQGVMNWSVVSAQFMIIAVGACLLMIAGEFDLSVGSMIGFSGMMIAIFGVTLAWPIWMAIIVTFIMAMAIGWLNGFIVVRTGLPSFIVTLAFLFILRGFTIFLPQVIERKTIIGGIKDAAEGDWLGAVFGGKILTGLFQWFGDMGIIATFERGTCGAAGCRRHPNVDRLGHRPRHRRPHPADPHPIRQLDLCIWWRRGGRAELGCSCEPRKDLDVHVLSLLRDGVRNLSGDGVRLCGG